MQHLALCLRLTHRYCSIHPSQDPKNRCSDVAIKQNPAGCEIVEVPQLTCATLMERHGIPFLLKIDIEGADLYCLESLRRLKERPKYVAVEVNESLDLLVELGYTKVSVPGTAAEYASAAAVSNILVREVQAVLWEGD